MSIRRRNGRWQIDYYPEGRRGRRVRVSLPETVTDEAAAKAIEVELRRAAKPEGSLAEIRERSLVKDLFAWYVQWYEVHRSPTTLRDLNSVWKNHLSPHLGRFVADDINAHHLDSYVLIRKGEGGTNRTVTKELHYFSGFLRWAARKGHITRRQWTIERLPYSRPIPMVLTLQEALAFIHAAEQPYRTLFLLLFNLGVRLREARLLKWESVDFGNRSITILQKGGRQNILPLSDWLLRELKALKRTASSEWVFPSARDPRKPLVDVRKAAARASTAARIEKHVYPHLLRHTFATLMVGRNVNLRHVQAILGHRQISTTEWYTQVAVRNKREALKLGGMLKAPKTGDYKKCRKY